MLAEIRESKQIFIDDQQWELLLADAPADVDRGLRQIDASPRGGAPAAPTAQPDAAPDWAAIGDRRAFLKQLGTDERFRSVVFTQAGGLGKSVTLAWLQYVLSRPEFGCVPVLVTASNVKKAFTASVLSRHDILLKLLTETVASKLDAPHNEQTLLALRLQRARDEGRLILLVDAIDEVGPDDLTTFCECLGDRAWKNLRVILGARPYAVRHRRKNLLASRDDWRYVRMMPFTDEQCSKYLSAVPEAREWFDRLPRNSELRETVRIPRVLKYVRNLGQAQLEKAKSSTDIMHDAMRHMLVEGLKNTPDARMISNEDGKAKAGSDPTKSDIKRAMRALATIAWLTTRGDGEPEPCFEALAEELAMERFKKRLGKRLRPKRATHVDPLSVADKVCERLGRLNIALQWDIFDTGHDKLEEIRWQNRLLQSFFCGYYLANFATPADVEYLWDKRWIVEWDRTESESMYEIWRTVADLPQIDERAKSYAWRRADPETWLRTVELLYRPCFQEKDPMTGRTVYRAVRSCEFIYRTWWRLNEMAAEPWDESASPKLPNPRNDKHAKWIDQARRIRDIWWGEFEDQILDNKQGPHRKKLAKSLCDDFLRLPTGNFFLRGGDEPIQVHEFYLGRRPVTNGWLLLFAPEHGQRGWCVDNYARISGTDNHPAIYVDFYLAWCFCVWVRFGGQSCRLPFEDEFRYATFFGLTPEQQLTWKYWWHAEKLDNEKCVVDQDWWTGSTKPSSPVRANPGTIAIDNDRHEGLMDLVGNVIIRSADPLRPIVVRNAGDEKLWYEQSHTSRKMLGRCWSKNKIFFSHPSWEEDDDNSRVDERIGFRTARSCISRAVGSNDTNGGSVEGRSASPN